MMSEAMIIITTSSSLWKFHLYKYYYHTIPITISVQLLGSMMWWLGFGFGSDDVDAENWIRWWGILDCKSAWSSRSVYYTTQHTTCFTAWFTISYFSLGLMPNVACFALCTAEKFVVFCLAYVTLREKYEYGSSFCLSHLYYIKGKIVEFGKPLITKRS